jgi:hypothetical protein
LQRWPPPHKFSQNKRARDEYWNGGLALPDAKTTNSGSLVYDSDLIALLEKIDNMDANNNNPEETHTVIQLEGEMRLNGVVKSLEDETGLKVQTDNNIESTDEKGSTDQIGSNKQGELTAEGNSEATSVTSDIGDFTYYDDVHADLDFFVDPITPYEFGIIMPNYLDRDSVPDIMYSDPVHGYVENTEVSYGSLWDDDIWLLNEQPIIQNDSESPQQEEFGSRGAEFHDFWN